MSKGPRLPWFCPSGCKHLNEHIDDNYLLEYGLCANCWFEIEHIEGMKEATNEERVAKVIEIREAKEKYKNEACSNNK